MGNNLCSPQHTKNHQDIANNYQMQYIRKHKDTFLGLIDLFRSDEQYFVFIEKKFTSHRDYEQYVDQCEQ